MAELIKDPVWVFGVMTGAVIGFVVGWLIFG
jgi:gas vesicle protein